MNYNADCLNVYSMVGVGMSTSFAAGTYAYGSCAFGNCTSRATRAAIYVEPSSMAPVFPDALVLTSFPQAVAMETIMRPAPSVLLSGALTADALYRSDRSFRSQSTLMLSTWQCNRRSDFGAWVPVWCNHSVRRRAGGQHHHGHLRQPLTLERRDLPASLFHGSRARQSDSAALVDHHQRLCGGRCVASAAASQRRLEPSRRFLRARRRHAAGFIDRRFSEHVDVQIIAVDGSGGVFQRAGE
jgi:hypothetical protein